MPRTRDIRLHRRLQRYGSDLRTYLLSGIGNTSLTQFMIGEVGIQTVNDG